MILDGPMGSLLEARGVPLPAPAWTAAAVAEHPDAVREVHRSWSLAGAQVHTSATFRTTARALRGTAWDGRWRELTDRAVALCRDGAGPLARVAGSLAPLEDCFLPARTPPLAAQQREHGDLAAALAAAGVDLLLVETMPTVEELGTATRCAAATGLPTWSAITLGPAGDFFSPREVETAASVAADAGAEAFLINCTPPALITPLLARVARLAHRPPALGAYANAIFPGHAPDSPAQYKEHARAWRDAGASILGTCCGTTPAHLAALLDIR